MCIDGYIETKCHLLDRSHTVTNLITIKFRKLND